MTFVILAFNLLEGIVLLSLFANLAATCVLVYK